MVYYIKKSTHSSPRQKTTENVNISLLQFKQFKQAISTKTIGITRDQTWSSYPPSRCPYLHENKLNTRTPSAYQRERKTQNTSRGRHSRAPDVKTTRQSLPPLLSAPIPTLNSSNVRTRHYLIHVDRKTQSTQPAKNSTPLVLYSPNYPTLATITPIAAVCSIAKKKRPNASPTMHQNAPHQDGQVKSSRAAETLKAQQRSRRSPRIGQTTSSITKKKSTTIERKTKHSLRNDCFGTGKKKKKQ